MIHGRFNACRWRETVQLNQIFAVLSGLHARRMRISVETPLGKNAVFVPSFESDCSFCLLRTGELIIQAGDLLSVLISPMHSGSAPGIPSTTMFSRRSTQMGCGKTQNVLRCGFQSGGLTFFDGLLPQCWHRICSLRQPAELCEPAPVIDGR